MSELKLMLDVHHVVGDHQDVRDRLFIGNRGQKIRRELCCEVCGSHAHLESIVGLAPDQTTLETMLGLACSPPAEDDQ